jgi:hypothetical protein
LEAAVWGHVHRLIADPGTLRAQFDARATTPDGTSDGRAEAEKWAAQLRRLDREEVRLVDAYQAEAISLDELKERREQLRVRRQAAVAQRDAGIAARASRAAADAAWREWATFCERIRGRLASLSADERQQILRLVVERVIVKDGALEVRHVIPLAELSPAAGTIASSVGSDAQGASAGRLEVRLCSDRILLRRGRPLREAEEGPPGRDRRGGVGEAAHDDEPPAPGAEGGKIAVKVISHYGDEVLKVFRLP